MSIKKIESFVGEDAKKLTDLDISPGEPLLLLNFAAREDKKEPLLLIFNSWQKIPWTRDQGGVNILIYPYHGEESHFSLRVENDIGYELGEPIKFGELELPNIRKKYFGSGTCEETYEVNSVYSGREAIIRGLEGVDEFVSYAAWFKSTSNS